MVDILYFYFLSFSLSGVSASASSITESYLSLFCHYSIVNIDCSLLNWLTYLGLCGSPRITDVGGVPYLVPIVQKHKVLFLIKLWCQEWIWYWHYCYLLPSFFQEYDMNAISKELELPGAFLLGAAGAPSRILGMNAEVTHMSPHAADFYWHSRKSGFFSMLYQ